MTSSSFSSSRPEILTLESKSVSHCPKDWKLIRLASSIPATVLSDLVSRNPLLWHDYDTAFSARHTCRWLRY